MGRLENGPLAPEGAADVAKLTAFDLGRAPETAGAASRLLAQEVSAKTTAAAHATAAGHLEPLR